MSDIWEVYALKYGDRNERTRRESFIFDALHDLNHPIDYFIWLLRKEDEVIVVDTGYDSKEAARRGRPILREPSEALAAMGIQADEVTSLILTHLHYDHAGGLTQFPNATIHLQAAEMAYATGPCMCHDVLQMPFSVEHVCEMVRRVYSGRCVYHQGEGQVADGVSVHLIGGHTRGLQAVRVKTRNGWLCLASDTAHFYENLWQRNPFPIVVDLENMLEGYNKLEKLASAKELIIPGHDPLVCDYFPTVGQIDFAYRLDAGTIKKITF